MSSLSILVSCGNREMVDALEDIRDVTESGDFSQAKMTVFGDSTNTGAAIKKDFNSSDFLENDLDFSSLVNHPKLAWTWLTAEHMGFAGDELLIAARNGARSEHFSEQVSEALRETDSRLSPWIFIQFTGNDLCRQEDFDDMSANEFGERYLTNLKEGLEELASKGKVDSEGTDIFLPPFLHVSQLLEDPHLLYQEDELFGVEITCGDMQKRVEKDEWSVEQREMIKALYSLRSAMCRSLLDLDPDEDPESVAKMEEIVSAFRQAQRAFVDHGNDNFGDQGMRFHYLDGLENFRFERGDLAFDCFHPGEAGHRRWADELIRVLNL